MGAPDLPLVVDTDGGIDDLAALWWLAGRADVRLGGVIATGVSRPARTAARNARLILDLVGARHVDVALGADEPFGPAPTVAPVPHHGPEGLGPLAPGDISADGARFGSAAGGGQRATELLAHVGPCSLLTLGPLSTLARLIAAGHAGLVRTLTVMGGSVGAGGNALPASEANIARDPSAAATVLAHAWPRPARLITLDATLSATLRMDDIADIGRAAPAGPTLAALLGHYASHAGQGGSFPCHDLLAACSVAEDGLVGTQLLPVKVDTGGSAAWGMTVVDRRPRPTNVRAEEWPVLEVATRADKQRFRRVVRAVARAGTIG